ncbi:hypothetical protein CR513_09464, partial [Mucuna pruriens]
MEAEERHKKVDARHMDDLKAVGEREEELRHQLAVVKATMEKLGGAAVPPSAPKIDETAIPPNFCEVVIESFDGTQDLHTHLQAFQTQMYISRGNDRLSRKLFLGTLQGIAMNWLATLLPQSIRSFSDIPTSFAFQFTLNKIKCLEVADLFNIRQNKGETLESYLAWFNNTTVRKGLMVGQFNDSLTLRKPLCMEEIRAQAEKHIEVEEDQADWLEAKRQLGTRDMQPASQGGPRGEVKYLPNPRDYPFALTPPA